MKKIILKIKKVIKRGLAPYEAKGLRSGFVLLFAVTLAAIFLSIALGASEIALKEANFSTSAKDTGNAFYAADTGTECALYYDNSTESLYITGTSPSLTCNSETFNATEIDPTTGNSSLTIPYWTFIIPGLGSSSQSCVKVIMDKRSTPHTTVTADGYNVGDSSCNSTSTNRVDRELVTTY